MTTDPAAGHPAEQARAQSPWLVGVGASAGGLEALRALLTGVPPEAAYVIAQHMSPRQPSVLREVLARDCPLPVVEISDGMPVETGRVHIAPPNRDVEVVGRRFVAREAAKRISPQPSIDLLLESLAQEAGAHAVGVVLSGTGDDGTVGLAAVRRRGGVTLAQDPVSAAYPQMPQAAIESGSVDHVLLPHDIADVIGDLVEGREPQTGSGRWATGSAMGRLAEETRRVTGWDLTDYKDGTLARQVQRRVDALRLADLGDYVDLVLDNPGELTLLRDSLLIGVTGFLRDAEVFDALDDMLDDLVAHHDPGSTVRAWAAGAATGEEAYSVAMLLAEAVRRRGADLRVKVYCTDLSDTALDVARRGLYPVDSLAALPEELRDRYFTIGDDRAQVVPALRDLMVIARHDVARDPPLLRMDLVTCRNVLIYLIPSAQRRVVNHLASALVPGGLLVLGRSESIPGDATAFEPEDELLRIFRSREVAGARRPPATAATPRPLTLGRLGAPARNSRDQMRDTMRDLLLEAYGPPSVVVDDSGSLVRQFGDLSGLLTLPDGDSDFDIGSLVVPELRTEVVSVLTQALRSGADVMRHRVVLGSAGRARFLTVEGRRFHPEGSPVPLVLLSFVDSAPPAAGQPLSPDAERDELERELSGTRDHLRAVVEALEASNEELQAMNEELQASGEELQTSNEELQATNEELQATNEELTTVNETLAVRTAELFESNAVLQNIQSALDIGVILVDRQQRILRFSPLAVRVFGLMPQDVGTPLHRAPRHLPLGDLENEVDEVIQHNRGTMRDISVGGSTYLFQVMPYLVDDRVQGAVLAIADISELSEARSELRRRAEEFQALAEAVPHMVYRTSVDMATPSYISPSVQELYGVGAEQVLADMSAILSLFHPDDLDAAVGNMTRAGDSGEDYQLDYRIVRPDGQVRHIRDVNRVIRAEDGTPLHRIGTAVDVTDLREALQDVERSRAYFQAIFDLGGGPLATLDPAGVVTNANEPMLALLGRDDAQLVGTPLIRLVHGADREIETELLERGTGEPGRPVQDLVRFVRPDGSVRYGQQRLVSITDSTASDASFVVTAVTDLTDLEVATRASRRAHLQLDALLRGSPAPMAVMGLDGVFRRCNQAMATMLGMAPESLVGKHFRDITDPADYPADQALFEDLVAGGCSEYVVDKHYLASDGSRVRARKFTCVVPSATDENETVVAQVMVTLPES